MHIHIDFTTDAAAKFSISFFPRRLNSIYYVTLAPSLRSAARHTGRDVFIKSIQSIVHFYSVTRRWYGMRAAQCNCEQSGVYNGTELHEVKYVVVVYRASVET